MWRPCREVFFPIHLYRRIQTKTLKLNEIIVHQLTYLLGPHILSVTHPRLLLMMKPFSSTIVEGCRLKWKWFKHDRKGCFWLINGINDH